MCILSGGSGEVRAGTIAGRLCVVPAEPAGTRSRPRLGLRWLAWLGRRGSVGVE